MQDSKLLNDEPSFISILIEFYYVKIKKHHSKYLILSILLFSAILFNSCANPLPPSGGPKDTTSPKIKMFYPPNKTLNFTGDRNISIQFDKYMNKNSVIENLNIQPKIQTDYDWSGKKLDIILKEKLKENTTYSVTLQANYTDYHAITPDEEFCLVFSTGKDLDSGMIKGRLIFGPKVSKTANTYIFVYSVDKINPDTLNPSHTKPDYKISIGNTGNFTVSALKDGKYRLFAVNDENKDDLINKANETYCCANSDLIVKNAKSSFAQLYMGNIRDITKPQLLSVEQLSANVIETQFSEPIALKSLSSQAFEITDSAGTNKVGIKYVFPDPVKKDIIHIIPTQLLKDRAKYKFICKLDSTSICDSVGNSVDEASYQMPFIANNTKDKFGFKISNMNIKDSSLAFHPDSLIYLALNCPPMVEFDSCNLKIIDMASNSEIEIQKEILADNILAIKPILRLQSDNWYYLSARFNNFTSALYERMQDTVLKVRFKTIDLRANVSVDGKLTNNTGLSSKFIITLISEKDRSRYVCACNDSLKWKINEIEPGDYKVEVFADLNNSGTYDFGTFNPFTFSEPIYFPEKVITLKPRWNLSDVKIEIP